MARLLNETALGPRPLPDAPGGLARYRAEIPDAEAPGMALRSAGASIGQEADKLFAQYKHEQAKVDTLRAEDAYTQLRTKQLEMTYGPSGYATRRGQDAVLGPNVQAQMATFEDQVKRIGSGLANDDQKRLFQQRAAVARGEFQEGFLRHQLKERNVWATDVTNNGLAAEMNQISSFYSKPGFDPVEADNATSASLIRMRALINAHADDLGKTEASVDKDMVAITDQVITNKLLAWSSWDPVGAYNDFKGHQAEISDPKHRLLLRNTLWERAIPVQTALEAQRLLDEAREKYPPEVVSPGQQSGVTTVGGEQGQARKPTAAEMKLAVLMQELNDPQKSAERSPGSTRELNEEISRTYRKARPQGGAFDPNQPAAQSVVVDRVSTVQTNPVPTARQVAAQLPLAIMNVEKRANELYGKDPANADRAAFIRLTEAEIRSRNNHDVQMINNQQKEALALIGNLVLGPAAIHGQATPQGAVPAGGAGGGAQRTMVKMTSFGELMANPQAAQAYRLLDYDAKRAVDTMLRVNANDSDRGDPALFNELRNSIAEGRISWNDQITKDPRVQAGNLNITQMNFLRAEIDRQATEDGRTQGALVKRGTQIARAIFQGDMILTNAGMDKGKADVAEELFSRNAAKAVAEYRNAKPPKDISELFDITNQKSLIYPPNLEQWKVLAQAPASSAEMLRAAADKAQATAVKPPVVIPATIKTIEQRDAWFKTLPADQTTFTAPDGRVFLIPGRAVTAPAAVPADQIRQDGSRKGPGFLGELRSKDGRTSTEISIGVNVNGKEMEIPTLVPTLTKAEIASLLAGDRPSDAIVDKAVTHARARIAAGKPVFAQPDEEPKAAPAVKKAKGDIPAFNSQRPDPQDTENHLRGLWEAVKAVVKASTDFEPAGRMMVQGSRELIGYLLSLRESGQEAGTRAVFKRILQSESFTDLDVPMIEAAVKYGNLDPGDLKKAKAMLKAAGR